MSRRAPDALPEIRLHRPRNLAKINISGQTVYLGTWGTEGVQGRYDDTVARWLAAGRVWPPPDWSPVRTLQDLGARHLVWARAYYTKHGRETSTPSLIERALDLLEHCGLAGLAPGDLRPAHLRQFQAWLCNDPHKRWARGTINRYTRIVVDLAHWGVEYELLPASVWHTLQAVRPLRRGRPPAPDVPPPRDGRPVQEIPAKNLEPVLAILPPMVRAMADLQLLTGMRPGEIVAMRAGDLAPAILKGVVVYTVRPEINKVDHHEIERRVFIGPRGMDVLRPWLPQDATAHVFSPRRAEEARHAARSLERQTPRWPSHDPARRRERRGATWAVGDRYTEGAYRRAIQRACEELFGREPEGRARWWSPNQLRHNAATVIAQREKVEVAQLILGHSKITTTMRYTKVREHRAARAMLKHG